ncbi:hypothetical protein BH11ACT8_BH11ACT8_09890 [soil metagenome]
MTTIVATIEALLEAARLWEGQGTELDAIGVSLDDVDPGLLGSRVAPVARVFLEHWGTRVGALERQADANGAAIRDFVVHLGHVDAAAAARLRALLPFAFDTDVPAGS